MNRENIIRMAIEAGLNLYVNDLTEKQYLEVIEHFAALVASAEREECKKLCTWKTGNQFVDEAVAVCYRAIDQRGQE